jgi:hypothetical protein
MKFWLERRMERYHLQERDLNLRMKLDRILCVDRRYGN